MSSREAFPGPPHLSLEPLILLLQVPTGLDSDVSSDEAQRWEGISPMTPNRPVREPCGDHRASLGLFCTAPHEPPTFAPQLKCLLEPLFPTREGWGDAPSCRALLGRSQARMDTQTLLGRCTNTLGCRVHTAPTCSANSQPSPTQTTFTQSPLLGSGWQQRGLSRLGGTVSSTFHPVLHKRAPAP